MKPHVIDIVTPAYNDVAYLEQTRKSVVAQTHTAWHWWVVDDGSTDGTRDVVATWAAEDPRIHLLTTPTNSGAGRARNIGIDASGAPFVAFLDADDLWHPDKLERQVGVMATTRAYFSYTGFQYVAATGEPTGAVVSVPTRMTYRAALRNTTILTSTVMIRRDALPDTQLRFPDIRRGQDTALWWRLLRIHGPADGIPDALSSYRQTPGSLSANRVTAARRTWHLYRQVEGLSRTRASWLFLNYAVNALWRRRGKVARRS